MIIDLHIPAGQLRPDHPITVHCCYYPECGDITKRTRLTFRDPGHLLAYLIQHTATDDTGDIQIIANITAPHRPPEP